MDPATVATQPPSAQVTRRAWSLQQDTTLQDARRQGLSWELISELLPGKSPTECRTRCKHLLEAKSAAKGVPHNDFAQAHYAMGQERQGLPDAIGESDWSVLGVKSLGTDVQRKSGLVSTSVTRGDSIDHEDAGDSSLEEDLLAIGQKRESSNPSTHKEHEVFHFRLLTCCLRNLRELWKALSDSGAPEQISFSLQEQLDRLFLWEQGFTSKELQKVVSLFKEETDLMLECLTDIGRWILQKIKSFAHSASTEFYDTPKQDHLQGPKELELLMLQADSVLESRSEDKSMENDYEVNSLLIKHNEEFEIDDGEISVDDLQSHVDRLIALSPALKQSIDVLERLEAEQKAPLSQPSSLMEGASLHASKLRGIFEKGDEALILRLGDANSRRHMELSKMGCQVPPIRELRRLHESSIEEVKLRFSRLTVTPSELPPIPGRRTNQDHAKCYVCLKEYRSLSHVRWSSSGWRNHFFADLCPYTCVFQGCSEGMTRFADIESLLEHSEVFHCEKFCWRCPECLQEMNEESKLSIHFLQEHGQMISRQNIQASKVEIRTDPAQEIECPLCRKIIRGTIRVFITHVCVHLERISLMSLPLSRDHGALEAERAFEAEQIEQEKRKKETETPRRGRIENSQKPDPNPRTLEVLTRTHLPTPDELCQMKRWLDQ